MILKLVPSTETQRVSAQDILDYNTFARRHQNLKGKNELKQFERFHAARHLISQEMDTYLDAKLTTQDRSRSITVDVCGIKNGAMTAVFCQTAGLDEPLARSLETINKSRNTNAVILLPKQLAPSQVEESVRVALKRGKTTMEVLGWFGDTFEETFRETLSLIELLGNETRMRMLAPLLEKSGAKRDYRTRINPKLVYHNISALSDAGILDENAEGAYELSQFGKTLIAEFITFLERTRKTLDESRAREVKND
jgi:DNA-binding transcriptional ArsR family regulator